jgi:hypothetical protein
MEWTVFFELYGKKMKTTVKAERASDAMDAVKQKIIFHKIEPAKQEPAKNIQDDETLKNLKTLLGMD